MPLTFTPLLSGRYTARASLTLRVLQGVDLNTLVRETIQNSLDAAAGDISVTVDFTISESPTAKICNIFDENTASRLDKKFKKVPASKVLVIRDTGTTGLTGGMNDPNSKIYKLIYDIGHTHPEENAGAGGSWGLGKTIYYHMGAGLVGFYSQSHNSKNQLASSLAFSYIEDERKTNRLINKTPTGIAWWGGAKGVPIHSKRSIEAILRKLGIAPFKEGETGTCIIIPFFAHAENLLNRDQGVESVDEAEYIKLAIQRWYPNRLIRTQGKPTLIASVNGENVDEVPPVFKAIQSLRKLTDDFKLHKKAKSGSGLKLIPAPQEELDWTSDERENSTTNTYLKAITLNNIFQKDDQGNTPPAGWIAARLLSKADLGMLPPGNLSAPHEYIFGNATEIDQQLPIIAMSRSPQMIINYDINEWRSGLRLDMPGEYLIALFILNPNARLLDGTNFEEYIRSIENPTHSDWVDPNTESEHARIPGRIRNNVRNALRAAFFDQNAPAVPDAPRAENIRAQLGQSLLPPDFGTAGTRPRDVDNGRRAEPPRPSTRQSQPTLHIDDTQYLKDGIKLCLTIFNAQKTNLKVSIDADTGSGKTMTSAAWVKEITSPIFPFELTEFTITETRIIPNEGRLPAFRAASPHDVQCTTDSASASLNLREGILMEFKAELTLKTNDRSVKPVIKLSTTEV
jgi:hypothetical protein